jgi:hypothetical protein
MNDTEGAKLLLSYDVQPGQMEEYFRFFVGRYIPLMQTLGLEVSEAWQTAYGKAPNRLIAFIAPSQERVLGVIQDEAWNELNDELENFVFNFEYKVIPLKQGFQF